MKPLLRELVKLYQENDEFKRRLESYQRAIKSEDWKFLTDTILVIKGNIYTDMLSARYTKLTPSEKDVAQRTYYQLMQVLEFLQDPLKWIKSKQVPETSIKGRRSNG